MLQICLGEDSYQQNSDLLKPWGPLATIQGLGMVPSLSHLFFLYYLEVVGSNPGTPLYCHIKLLQENCSTRIMFLQVSQFLSFTIHFSELSCSTVIPFPPFLEVVPNCFPGYLFTITLCILSAVLFDLEKAIIPLTTPLTHCMAALLRKSGQCTCKELGRRTGSVIVYSRPSYRHIYTVEKKYSLRRR